MPARDKMFTQATIEKDSFNDEERSFVAWASKPVLDRDGEIIASDAWDTTNYEKNKVLLWAHDYSMPSVGKILWLKQQKNGLKFKPQFAPTAMGDELFTLYKGGFLNSFSVGFIPKDFEEDEEETVEFMGFFGGKFEKPLLTYTDVELLEISCVPVPSCPDALVERMANEGIAGIEIGQVEERGPSTGRRKGKVPDDLFEQLKHLGQESSLAVTGTVRADDRSVGGYELAVTDAQIVSPADTSRTCATRLVNDITWRSSLGQGRPRPRRGATAGSIPSAHAKAVRASSRSGATMAAKVG